MELVVPSLALADGDPQLVSSTGCATEALARMLLLAADEGLTEVELVTDVDNIPSQRVVESNGGVHLEEFTQVDRLGGGRAVRWRIDLS